MPSRLTVVLVSLLLTAPVVIFLVWLVILPVKFETVCPEKCKCETEGFFVNCSHSGLKSIPSNIPTHVLSLEVNGNNITYFENETFVSRGLVELEILQADFCKLRKIELGSFKGLTKLKILSMMSNEISDILPGTFEKISLLEMLFLDNNIIEHLESDVFIGLVNIKIIGLQGNKLQYIHPDTFLGLSKFQGLQIKNHYPFMNLYILKVLATFGCKASSVSVETFANISTLKVLELSNNNLRGVDINVLKVLPNLSAFYLHGNPLHCDCQLQEVWRWCQDHNIQTGFRGIAPECDTPSEVKGIWWGVLEKGQCLEGNIEYYGDYKNTSFTCTPIEDMDREWEMYIEIPQGKNVLNFLTRYGIHISAVFFIIGTTGNIIIIIIITCNKDMRTVPNMCILNLAISDIIYLTLLFSEICAYKFNDVRPCGYFPFFRRLSFGLTAYSITVLSIQRYRVTINSLYFHVSSKPTWRATGATICGVWIVAALFAIPAGRSMYLCFKSLLLWRTKYYELVAIFHLLVSCVLPLFVIAFSYIMTARHLLKSSCSLSEETQNSRMNTRKNAAKIVLGLTVVFLTTSVPYHFSETFLHSTMKFENVFQLFNEKNEIFTFENMRLILNILFSINSCLNPVALFLTSLAFRRQFKRYLTCCCKAKSTPTDFELEGR